MGLYVLNHTSRKANADNHWVLVKICKEKCVFEFMDELKYS